MRTADYKRAKDELRRARIAMHLVMNQQLSMDRYRLLGWDRYFSSRELRAMASELAYMQTLADFTLNNA